MTAKSSFNIFARLMKTKNASKSLIAWSLISQPGISQ
jgi:hypothetical protein